MIHEFFSRSVGHPEDFYNPIIVLWVLMDLDLIIQMNNIPTCGYGYGFEHFKVLTLYILGWI